MKDKAESKNIIRAFVGIAGFLENELKASFLVKLYVDSGKCLTLQPTIVKLNKDQDIAHAVNLYALKQVIEVLSDTNYEEVMELYFYPTDRKISFEYNTEYLKDGQFNKQTKDLSLWNKVINLVNGSKINLHIKDNNSALSGVNKLV